MPLSAVPCLPAPTEDPIRTAEMIELNKDNVTGAWGPWGVVADLSGCDGHVAYVSVLLFIVGLVFF